MVFDMVAERCVDGTRWTADCLAMMAATDEDLQELGKPPIFSGKEDEWNEWSFSEPLSQKMV